MSSARLGSSMRGIVMAALLLSPAAWATEWRALPAGERCVATNVLTIADGGRQAPTNDAATRPNARQIVVRLWHPTDRCSGTPLPFWRYWAESESAARAALVERVRSLGGDEKLAEQAADKALGQPLA